VCFALTAPQPHIGSSAPGNTRIMEGLMRLTTSDGDYSAVLLFYFQLIRVFLQANVS
jgi:hypothetical protein